MLNFFNSCCYNGIHPHDKLNRTQLCENRNRNSKDITNSTKSKLIKLSKVDKKTKSKTSNLNPIDTSIILNNRREMKSQICIEKTDQISISNQLATNGNQYHSACFLKPLGKQISAREQVLKETSWKSYNGTAKKLDEIEIRRTESVGTFSQDSLSSFSEVLEKNDIRFLSHLVIRDDLHSNHEGSGISQQQKLFQGNLQQNGNIEHKNKQNKRSEQNKENRRNQKNQFYN